MIYQDDDRGTSENSERPPFLAHRCTENGGIFSLSTTLLHDGGCAFLNDVDHLIQASLIRKIPGGFFLDDHQRRRIRRTRIVDIFDHFLKRINMFFIKMNGVQDQICL